MLFVQLVHPPCTGWAVLQLKETSELIPAGEVEQDLRRRWPRVTCRFPAVKQGYLDRDNPLSSYIFVLTPLATAKLESSPFVTRFMRHPVTRRLATISDAELAAMAPTLQLPSPGSVVRVTAGDWAGLEGTVVECNCQSVKALVELWSRQSVLTLAPNEFQPV